MKRNQYFDHNHSQKALSCRYNMDTNRVEARLVSILKRQESSLFMVNLISISNGVCSDVLNPAIKPVVDLSIGLCFARLHIFAHFLHT